MRRFRMDRNAREQTAIWAAANWHRRRHTDVARNEVWWAHVLATTSFALAAAVRTVFVLRR